MWLICLKMLILLDYLSVKNFLITQKLLKILIKIIPGPLNHYKSQKTLKKSTRINRFEKNLLGFFGSMVCLKFSQLNKTLNDLHLALELETNLLNPNLLKYKP